MKTYINNVLPKKVSDLVDDSGHYTKPSGGIPASDLADGVIPVEDVQVNGTSIVADGVANVPVASGNNFGVVKVANGLRIDTGRLVINRAAIDQIKEGVNGYTPIVPYNQHESTFYGLAKAAGDTTQLSSNNAVGNYTDSAKTAIKNMLGVPEDPLAVGTALHASADLNSYTTPGNYTADSTVIASITNAPTTTDTYKLVVETVSETVIEQIVTAANGKVYRRTGDSSSSSWTFSSWVKDISSVDVASTSTVGVVKIGDGFSNPGDGTINVDFANADQIKAGSTQRKSITPYQQHRSVFYGLAKAAGVDMSSSSNAVGTYTDDAKTAIQKMLGIYEAPWELIREETFTNETEADHIITTDSNEEPLDLTSAIILFETPQQETYAAKGTYGQIWFYSNGSSILQAESGAWTQNANTASHGCAVLVENKNGIFTSTVYRNTTSSNLMMAGTRYGSTFKTGVTGIKLGTYFINKITIPKVTGTGHYILYGKRKWQ